MGSDLGSANHDGLHSEFTGLVDSGLTAGMPPLDQLGMTYSVMQDFSAGAIVY